MLVYLDTAQFAWLERADPATREQFLRLWNRFGHQLVLSLFHLQEFAQLESDGFERRMRLVDSLGVVLFPSDDESLVRIEVEERLAHRGPHESELTDAVRTRLFQRLAPYELWERASLVRRFVAVRMREALAASAAAEESGKRAARTSGSQRSKLPGNADYLRAALQQVRDWFQQQSEVLPEELTSLVLGRLDQVRPDDLAGRPQRDLVRALLGIGGDPAASGAPKEELTLISAFRDNLARWDLLGEDAYQVDPYSIPSFRLSAALMRGRKRNPQPSDSSTLLDSEHVTFAPYVDHLFVDKRTMDLVDQDRRRKASLLQPDDVQAISCPRTLQEVQGTLFPES